MIQNKTNFVIVDKLPMAIWSSVKIYIAKDNGSILIVLSKATCLITGIVMNVRN
jgi:hypothetical protein